MADSGITTAIKAGGTPVLLGAEPMTAVEAGFLYQITDATKRVLDPSFPVIVEVDPDGFSGFTEAPDGSFIVDHFFGKVNFGEDQGADAVVRIESSGAKYIPTLTLAECTEVTCTFTREKLDFTVFHPTNKAKLYKVGKAELSGKVAGFTMLFADLDPGDDILTLIDRLTNGTPVLLEVAWPNGLILRAWVILDAEQMTAVEDGQVMSEVNYTSSSRTAVTPVFLKHQLAWRWSDLWQTFTT